MSRYALWSKRAFALAVIVALGVPTILTAGADEGAVRAAIADLQSSFPAVREHAAVTLGRASDLASVPALTRALQDPSRNVRRECAKALGFLKSPRAVDALQLALSDADANVRLYAAYALGEIKDRRATKALVKALDDPEWTVRDQAAWALREIGDPTIVQRLLTMIARQDDPPSQIVWLLKHLNRELTLIRLNVTLRSPDARFRLAAIRTMAQLEDRQAVEPAISALKDSDPRVRRVAASLLGLLKNDRALEPLARLAAEEPDRVVRDAAEQALKRLSHVESLMAHWSFDDTGDKVAQDLTGRGNDGDVKRCISVPGRVGAAFRFGPGRYVELGRPPDMPITNVPFTVTAWVKSEAADGVIVARGGAFCGFSLYLKDGTPRFGIHRMQEGPGYVAKGKEPVADRWVFLAGVVKANQIELFVDGELMATTKTKGFIPGNCGQGMQIGVDTGTSPAEITDPFHGIIDEVKVYQAALSARELAAEFRKEAGQGKRKT